MTQRKPFMPLDPDLDNRMERLAQEKGVAKLERPPIHAFDAQGSPSVHADPLTPDAHVAAEPAVAGAPATPRSRMKTVNLEVPDYLSTDLKVRAAHKQTSVRHVVMAALIKDGFVVKDADMIEDGRRLRGSNKPAH